MIELHSVVYAVAEIKRKTRAETFADWRVGDRVRFSTVMKAMAGASGGGVSASMYYAENLTQGTRACRSQSNMNAVVGSFELRPETEMCAPTVSVTDSLSGNKRYLNAYDTCVITVSPAQTFTVEVSAE